MIFCPEEKGLNVMCKLGGPVASVGLLTDIAVLSDPFSVWLFHGSCHLCPGMLFV